MAVTCYHMTGGRPQGTPHGRFHWLTLRGGFERDVSEVEKSCTDVFSCTDPWGVKPTQQHDSRGKVRFNELGDHTYCDFILSWL